MFMAPFDQDVDWTQAGIQGAGRFLNRVWSLYQSTYYSSHTTTQPDPDLERALHRTIQQVTERIADFRLNTMIAALMEFANLLGEYWRTDRWQTSTYHDALNVFLILLAPAAPHISEELWHLTGHAGSVHQQTWPEASADLLVADDVEVPVQINGRLRATIRLPLHASSALAEARALADPKVQQFLQHGHIERVYYVPDKIINLIVN